VVSQCSLMPGCRVGLRRSAPTYGKRWNLGVCNFIVKPPRYYRTDHPHYRGTPKDVAPITAGIPHILEPLQPHFCGTTTTVSLCIEILHTLCLTQSPKQLFNLIERISSNIMLSLSVLCCVSKTSRCLHCSSLI